MAERDVEIKLSYKADTADAEKKTNSLRGSVGNLASSYDRLQSRLMGAVRGFAYAGAGALGVGIGFGALARGVIGANVELERTQKRIAGTLFAFTRWKEGVAPVMAYRASLAEARKMTEEFEKAEERLAISADEIGGAYARLVPQLSRYGVSLERQQSLAVSAASAAKVYGVDTGRVGFVVSQMLRGIPVRDPLSQLFVRSKQEMKAFMNLKPEDKLQLIEKRLKAMEPAAEEASKGFEGAMFRAKDFISDTLRDVGKPTFEFIARKIEEWRVKLNQTVDGGKKLYEVYGEKILGAVKKVASVLEWMAEHWKAIAFTIAGIQLSNITLGIAGMAKEVLGLVGALGKLTGATMMGGAAGGAAVLGKAGLVGAAGAAGYGAASWVMGLVDKYTPIGEEFRGIIDKLATRGDEPGALQRKRFLEEARVARNWEKIGKATEEPKVPGIRDLSKPWKGGDLNLNGPINIVQKFEEADPDNVYIRFRDDIEKAAENVTMSRLQPTFGG